MFQKMQNTMNFIYDFIQLIKFSQKRLTIFENFRKEIFNYSGEITSSLQVLCPTRWIVRHASIYSILKNYIQDCQKYIARSLGRER